MKTTNTFLALTFIATLGAPCLAQEVDSTISFTSTRDNPTGLPQANSGEIYLIDSLSNGTFSDARRLTKNEVSDFFPTFSPDGKGKIIFDSNERRQEGAFRCCPGLEVRPIRPEHATSGLGSRGVQPIGDSLRVVDRSHRHIDANGPDGLYRVGSGSRVGA